MNMDTVSLIGVIVVGLAYVILVFAYWQYIKMIKSHGGAVAPNPASWLVFGCISLGNAVVLWDHILPFMTAFPIIMSVAQFCIAYVSYQKRGGRLETADKLALFIAIIGILLWIGSHQLSEDRQYWWVPILALLIADGVGFYPTLRDAWNKPHADDLTTWAVFVVVAALVLVGLYLQTETKQADIIYPAYELLLASSFFFTLIVRRRYILPSVVRGVITLRGASAPLFLSIAPGLYLLGSRENISLIKKTTPDRVDLDFFKAF